MRRKSKSFSRVKTGVVIYHSCRDSRTSKNPAGRGRVTRSSPGGVAAHSLPQEHWNWNGFQASSCSKCRSHEFKPVTLLQDRYRTRGYLSHPKVQLNHSESQKATSTVSQRCTNILAEAEVTPARSSKQILLYLWKFVNKIEVLDRYRKICWVRVQCSIWGIGGPT